MSGIKIAYGIDLDGDSLVIVRTGKNRRTIDNEVVYQGKTNTGDHALAAALATMRTAVQQNRAIVSGYLPARDTIARWLNTPFSSTAKAEAVFPSLLDTQMPFPLEQCVYQLVYKHAAPRGRDTGAGHRGPGAGGPGPARYLSSTGYRPASIGL